MLSKIFFVFTDKFGCIVEVFHIVPSVSFWAVANLANEIFNKQAFTSFDCPLVEQVVNLKRFKIVSIIVNKHGGGIIWIEAPKEVIKRLGSRFKLYYQENRVDLPVIWNFKLIIKASYPFLIQNWPTSCKVSFFVTPAMDEIKQPL